MHFRERKDGNAMAKLNILKLRNAKSQGETFKKEHPELVIFGSDIWENSITTGTKFTLKTETPDSRIFETSFELTKFDVDTVKGLIK